MQPSHRIPLGVATAAVLTVAGCAVDTRPTGAEPTASTSAALGIHRPFPQVPDRQGQILHAPTLVTIVAANDVPQGTDDTAGNLQGFSDVLPQSAVWAAVSSEYGVGALASAAHVTGPAMNGAFSRNGVRSYVSSLIAGGAGPAPNGNTVYLLYFPTAATFDSSLGSSCGYHFDYPGTATDSIAVVRRCTLNPGPETKLGAMTNIASHEIVEAATNPRGGGYNFDVGVRPGVTDIWAIWNGGDVELADLCEGTRTFESFPGNPSMSWELQRMWSNQAAAAGGDPCVPAAAQTYDSVSIPQDWYSVAPGQSVTIPVTGWSVATTGNWLLNVLPETQSSSGVFGNDPSWASDTVLSSPLGVGSSATCSQQGGPRQAINDEVTATLTVTAPANAQPGDYEVLEVTSYRQDGQAPYACNPALDEDHRHFWPVGVVVACPAHTQWNADDGACERPLVCHTPACTCMQAGGYWEDGQCQ